MNNSGALVTTTFGDLAFIKTSCPSLDEETPDPEAGTDPDCAARVENATGPSPGADADPTAALDTQCPTGQATQERPEVNLVESPDQAPYSRFELAPAYQNIVALDIAAGAGSAIRWPGLAYVPDVTHLCGLSSVAASFASVGALTDGIASRVVPSHAIAKALAPSIRVDLGLNEAVTKMAASWHLGLLDQHRQLAAPFAGLATAHNKALLETFSAVSVFNTEGIIRSLSLAPFHETVSQLSGLFRGWREIADFGFGLMRTTAQVVLAAALRARHAVVKGETEPVADFIVRWLGLRATTERIEAVSAALLEEGWDTSVDDPRQLMSDLKRRARRQARTLTPIWETQLNYRPVGLLDQPVVTRTGTLCKTADLVRDPQNVEDLAFASTQDHQQRVRHVLDRLNHDEHAVTTLYAQHAQLTWAEAARQAGASDPIAMGERVRRKLRRLGEEHKRRVALQPTGA
jgi:hypothetical protein